MESISWDPFKSTIPVLILICLQSHYCTTGKMIQRTACFNTVLDLRCAETEVLVFSWAHYGRNDTAVANSCGTYYQRNCDVDAHFTMNRLCAGKSKCALVVNEDLFGDPCGYEEFLVVSYTCVEGVTIQSTCDSKDGISLFDHGYIASPNYPKKYYMDADCRWTLAVQPRQTIRITLFDFELDVRRQGHCYDYLQITPDNGQHIFQDCGAMGKETFEIDSSTAYIRFKTSQSGLTPRGFIIQFEAVGPGCQDFGYLGNGSILYSLEHGDLTANITCKSGYVIDGTGLSSKHVVCLGSVWNETIETCLPVVTAVPTPAGLPPVNSAMPLPSQAASVKESGSALGIALGIVSALLLIALLLILTYHLHKRRKAAERKLDAMRVVFNNLQETALNDEGFTRFDDYNYEKELSNNKKVKKRKNKNNKEDILQTHNLLSVSNVYDEDYADPSIQNDTTIGKMNKECIRLGNSRRSSRSGRYTWGHNSHNVTAQGDYQWPETDFYNTTRRKVKHMRTRSGVWGKEFYHAKTSTEGLSPMKKKMTMSAPDLLDSVFLEYKNNSNDMCKYQNDSSQKNKHTLGDSMQVNTGEPHRTSQKLQSNYKFNIL